MSTRNHVVATAGHVDHGKSTLVRALTCMEPDRWEAERRRGLTIDLGFAWTALAPGCDVSFVDVPGHERFLGNALAGLGPASAVCFVVAADAGWQPQSSDHRDALAALGIEAGLIVITRADLAEPDQAARTARQAREELAGTGLAGAPLVTTSATTGAGLDTLRAELRTLLAAAAPRPERGVRLWLDRAFTVAGAGTVVTGTLQAGTIAAGDGLRWFGRTGAADVTVRGVQSRGTPRDEVGPVDRVAVNLRGHAADAAARGDVLLGPGPWELAGSLDVRRAWGAPLPPAGMAVRAHVGTAVVAGRLRPFDDTYARLTLERPLPLVSGDRILLRASHSRAVVAGMTAVDLDPPPLTRRGDARRRAEALARPADGPAERLRAARALPAGAGEPPAGARVVAGHWVDEDAWGRWREQLATLVDGAHARDPLDPGPSRGEATDTLALPPALLDDLATDTGLIQLDGRLLRPEHLADLGEAEAAIVELESGLRAEPFHAPESDDLAHLRLGRRELAAAERAGRLLRITGDVVLLPDGPARAMAVLADLPEPFTVSHARRAWGTTRRVAVPLLEYLDARGWTRRIDGATRVVVRRP